MKNAFLASALLFTLVGCHVAQINVHLKGYIATAKNEPAIGGQGEICISFAPTNQWQTGPSKCKQLYTDVNGNYDLYVNDSVGIHSINDLKTANLYLNAGGRFLFIKTFDATKIQPGQTLEFNFVNKYGYHFGKGWEIEAKSLPSPGSTYSDSGTIQEYASNYLTQMNPLEVLALVSHLSSNYSATKDQIIFDYALNNKDKLDRESINILAAQCSDSKDQNRVYSIANTRQ